MRTTIVASCVAVATSDACVAVGAQCGGSTFNGTACCVEGAMCKPGGWPYYNPPSPAYEHCVPECASAGGQCGGNYWKGVTCCAGGSTCTARNPYYSSCVADPVSTTSPEGVATTSPDGVTTAADPVPTTSPGGVATTAAVSQDLATTVVSVASPDGVTTAADPVPTTSPGGVATTAAAVSPDIAPDSSLEAEAPVELAEVPVPVVAGLAAQSMAAGAGLLATGFILGAVVLWKRASSAPELQQEDGYQSFLSA